MLTEGWDTLASTPSLGLATSGGQAVPLSLVWLTGSTWTAAGFIESYYSTGTASFNFSAADKAGNAGTVITSGGAIAINMLEDVAAQAGYFTNSDTMAVTVPAGAYGGSLYVVISTVPASRTSSADAAAADSVRPLSIDLAREFKAYDPAGAAVTSFLQPVTITMSYPDADNDGLIDGDLLAESRARIYYLDETLGKWTVVADCVRNAALNTVSAPVNHFSVYSVRTQSEEQYMLAPKAYPNPCDFKKQALTIFGIPPDAVNVKTYIYNSAAELVRTLSSGDGIDTGNKASWDGRLKNGSKTASGLYMYLVKTSNYGKGKGKFFVVW